MPVPLAALAANLHHLRLVAFVNTILSPGCLPCSADVFCPTVLVLLPPWCCLLSVGARGLSMFPANTISLRYGNPSPQK